MNSSVLFPPNCQSLSDGVIRDVLLRAKHTSHGCDRFQARDGTSGNAIDPEKTWQHHTNSISEPVRCHPDQPTSVSSFSSHVEEVFAESSPIASTNAPAVDKKTKRALAKAATTLNRRRQQSRVNMARHRKKMQDHVSNMETSIVSLREENHELETTPWLVVSEYFRLFRLALTASSTANHSTATSAYDVAVHRAFLQATMAPDLATNSGYGPEALLNDYHRLSTYHPGLDVQLLRLENSSEDLVTAATQMKISFTTSTLQNAFPHLINESELWKTIGSKLVGQQFVVHGFVHFRWDVVAGRVVSLDYKADMLAPMLKLLSNMADVARVFELASYKPDCGLRPRH